MSEYIPIEKLDYTFYKWIHISKDLIDLCYVGSTANLASRKRDHKSSCNNPNKKLYNNLLYTTMRENGGFDNFKMVILGTAEQLTKREAQALEEQYRIAEKATLNSNRCYTTDEQKVEQIKQYYQDHKADLIKKSIEYKNTHKEQKKQHDKKYRQLHKEKQNEYMKQYLQDNAEILTIKRRIKYLENKKAKKAEQN